MSFIKSIFIGSLVLIGGCTVVAGGCAVGVTKAGVSALNSMSQVVTESHFSTLYKANPAKAERLYKEIATECYSRNMRQKLGKTLPDSIVEARVDFDIFEIRTLRAKDETRIKYLEDWRVQSDKKIAASLPIRKQRSAVKRYLKDVRKKGSLGENLCIATGLAPDAEESRKSNQRYSSTKL